MSCRTIFVLECTILVLWSRLVQFVLFHSSGLLWLAQPIHEWPGYADGLHTHMTFYRARYSLPGATLTFVACSSSETIALVRT